MLTPLPGWGQIVIREEGSHIITMYVSERERARKGRKERGKRKGRREGEGEREERRKGES